MMDGKIEEGQVWRKEGPYDWLRVDRKRVVQGKSVEGDGGGSRIREEASEEKCGIPNK